MASRRGSCHSVAGVAGSGRRAQPMEYPPRASGARVVGRQARRRHDWLAPLQRFLGGGPMLIVFGMFAAGTASVALKEIVEYIERKRS
jgi:hypothetical protein